MNFENEKSYLIKNYEIFENLRYDSLLRENKINFRNKYSKVLMTYNFALNYIMNPKMLTFPIIMKIESFFREATFREKTKS